ncbi:MAG TPA: polysaccharide deacetylase family protein [Bacillus bacterium]|nr:polysaccharide deacetylase family protein [Bacillus sp. (in: firmicutes)]
MKWRACFFIVVLLFMVAACSHVESQGQQKETGNVQLEATRSSKQQDNNRTDSKEEGFAEDKQMESSSQVPLYKIHSANFNIEPLHESSDNIVLLTIDDAPDKYALEMAKTLQALKVNAIFFVNGHFLVTDEQKAVLKEIHDMGFLIGNHTMTHENLKKLSNEEQYKEIVGLNNVVEEIIGERPKFFRAPFGANTDYSRQLALDEKMVLMNWTYGYDFMKEYMSKEALTDIMVNTNLLHNGANLLMHDREWTRDALKDIVTGLQNKGYTIADPQLIETLQ